MKMDAPAWLWPLGAIGLLLWTVALTAWSQRPPAPADLEAEGFSAERAMESLHRLLPEDRPHPLGSAEQSAVRERLLDELRNLDLEPKVQAAETCSPLGPCGEVRNILVEFPGEGAEYVLLSAHTDSTAEGPGAGDDGASVAVLIELARHLKSRKLKNGIILLFTEGEEEGLLGALAFLEGNPLAARVAVAVNLEARGQSGRSMMFRTAGEDAWLIDAYASHVPSPFSSSVNQIVFEAMPHYTDLSAWASFGIPGMDFAFIDSPQAYHSSTDTVDALNPASVQSQGDNALAMALGLSQSDIAHPDRGHAAWFDVFGFFLVRWPRELSFWFCMTSVALSLLGLFLLRRSGRFRMLDAAAGLLAASLALAGSLLIGWLMSPLLEAGDGSWIALTALGLGILIWQIALALAWPKDLFGLLVGISLFSSFASVPVALFWPGAAHLLILPPVCAAVGPILQTVQGKGLLWGGLAGLGAAGVLWFPMVEGIRVALGPGGGIWMSGGLGMIMMWGIPIWKGACAEIRLPALAWSFR